MEAQLSRACSQMVAQRLHLAGETTSGGSEKPWKQPVPFPSTQCPWAYHGGLEGAAGGWDSCRFSLGSDSRRAPIVCATSWNTDLSRLSQSEGSLGKSREIQVLPVSWLRPGLPHRFVYR